MAERPRTLGQLQASGYPDESVRDEMRRNLMARLAARKPLFPGIIGYDDTVIPQIVNAILARHDLILLGLRGQAKTRIIRGLVSFLDDEMPIVAGSEVNDHPYHPISKHGVDLVAEHGDETPIEWVPRDARYGEKLATPDVTIADLIGDIDPIKAAAHRLHYSHEGVIHFGIVPRTNRGIFAINELPDLQPRIQVGLLNIMEEKDIQIRGFPVRIPLDVQMVFTANPENYTNRGNIITPLKDRIGSRVVTHYPHTLDDGIAITAQEAWTNRDGGMAVRTPHLFREIIEQIAVEARHSEYVDEKSGVSARMAISSIEDLVSNIERRALMNGEKEVSPRICDLYAMIPAITGRLELVYEGEQEGAQKVASALVGRAVRAVFAKYFPVPNVQKQRKSKLPFEEEEDRTTTSVGNEVYGGIVGWFDSGNTVSISDRMTQREYRAALDTVPNLRSVAEKAKDSILKDMDLYTVMEFVLEGLYAHSQLSKDRLAEGRAVYRDLMSEILGRGDESREW